MMDILALSSFLVIFAAIPAILVAVPILAVTFLYLWR